MLAHDGRYDDGGVCQGYAGIDMAVVDRVLERTPEVNTCASHIRMRISTLTCLGLVAS
jgi:hypothetical protein